MTQATTKSPLRFIIHVEDIAWTHRLPDCVRLAKRAARQTVVVLSPRRKLPKGEISILLTNNRQVHALNRDFRGKDKPTNVLSFPQFSRHQISRLAPETIHYLGDIALANQYIVCESKDQHKILSNHFQHLIIHGVLHILGYDHISERDAAIMECLETRILATLGVSDPYVVTPPKKAPRNSNSKAR